MGLKSIIYHVTLAMQPRIVENAWAGGNEGIVNYPSDSPGRDNHNVFCGPPLVKNLDLRSVCPLETVDFLFPTDGYGILKILVVLG